MTEAQWLESASPEPMLEDPPAIVRQKLPLFAHTICWQGWTGPPLSSDEDASRAFLTVAADALPDSYEKQYLQSQLAMPRLFPDGWQQWRILSEIAAYFWGISKAAQADILRDLCGNPWRPVQVSPAWLAWNDGIVKRLADGIHTECAFERLPILADALEEAGCAVEDILRHLRQPPVIRHVRHCWALTRLRLAGTDSRSAPQSAHAEPDRDQTRDCR